MDKDERTVVFDFVVFGSHRWIMDGSEKLKLGSLLMLKKNSKKFIK